MCWRQTIQVIVNTAIGKQLCDGPRSFLPPQKGAWGSKEASKFFWCTKVYRVILKTNSNFHTKN